MSINEGYFNECIAFSREVANSPKILQTAKAILELPNYHLCGYPSLPEGAHHVGTGYEHSVAYIGTTEKRHVVLSVRHKPFLLKESIESRLGSFNDAATRIYTPPLCIVRIPKNKQFGLIGLILEDVTKAGEVDLIEYPGEEIATLKTSQESRRVIVDPETFIPLSLLQEYREIGRAYLSAACIDLTKK